MATLPLVPSQIDLVLQQITLQMGLNLSNPNGLPVTQNYYGCRCEWQQQGQPAHQISEDVVYVRAIEVDDRYNRERYLYYNQGVDASGNDLNNQVTNYTRVWEVMWEVWGPNSFDNARQIRSQLFKQAIHDLFANSQLYCVIDPAAPVRLPDYLANQWWERVDFTCRFNEFVTEVDTQATILSNEIIVENFSGVIADITVED
jgi:hypothetical protein